MITDQLIENAADAFADHKMRGADRPLSDMNQAIRDHVRSSYVEQARHLLAYAAGTQTRAARIAPESDELIERLAAQAEAGYDLDQLRPRTKAPEGHADAPTE